MSGNSGTEAGAFCSVSFPRPVTLFERRSARFRALSATTPSLSGYLSLLATLTGRQAESAGRLPAFQPAATGLRALAVEHQRRDTVWQAVL
ncbi:MAG: formate dehydrogenase accessory protein FdhE, partial [Methylococcaceae bacterium]|nr:formate dehydrogenase accessory protein FdhE [Methylococcaceae bacterium]